MTGNFLMVPLQQFYEEIKDCQNAGLAAPGIISFSERAIQMPKFCLWEKRRVFMKISRAALCRSSRQTIERTFGFDRSSTGGCLYRQRLKMSSAGEPQSGG